MAVATLPALSREYVRVPVAVEGQDAAALTSLPVEFSFLVDKQAKPADNEWVLGSWEPGADTVARVLVGPGGTVGLTPGTYWVWVRVTGSIERPVRQAGQIKIV